MLKIYLDNCCYNKPFDRSTDAIMSSGMKCLIDKLGSVEAEVFVSMIRQNSFDYTEWRQNNLWQDMSIDEIFELAASCEKIRNIPPS